jgi:hypothetical protein
VGGDALLLGRTFHDVRTARAHLGERTEAGADRGDTVLLLPMLFKAYNEGLKSGELRLWNPLLFGGYPAWYDTMLHPFYPPHLAFHLLFPPGAAYTLTLLLHLFFAGAAMYRLCRGFGRSEAAATAAGLLWMLWGYSATWWSTGILEGASVFGPLALLALHRSKPVHAGIAAGLAILGSHPQHALLFSILLGAWALARQRREAPLFAVVALGVGMAAVLTRLDSLGNGFRHVGGDFDGLYDRPLGPLWHLAGTAFGKAWFPAHPLPRSEFPVYLGMGGTALALAGALRGFRDPRVRFLAVFGGAALLAAFARPLAELLMQVPLLNRSMPARWVFPAGFCLAVLAADGWDEVAKLPGRVPHALGAALALFAGLAAVLRLSGAAVAETAAGGALAIGACFTVRVRPRAALALGLGALLVDLLPPFVRQNRAAEPAALAMSLPRALVEDPGRTLGGLRRADAPPADPRAWNRSVGNNLLAMNGVEAFAGYEAILPQAYVDYALASDGSVAGSGRVAWFEDFGSPLLGAAGVTYLATPFGDSPGAPWTPIASDGPLRVFRNADAQPRARLASRVLPARDGREAAALLRSSAFDPRTAIVVEGAPPASPAGGRVEWLDPSPQRPSLRVAADGPALLFLADAWDEGWEAEVDGRAAPVYRANVMFRAVAVPAGEHVVAFRFRPACVRSGLLVTGLSLLAAAGFLAKRFFASRRKAVILP